MSELVNYYEETLAIVYRVVFNKVLLSKIT